MASTLTPRRTATVPALISIATVTLSAAALGASVGWLGVQLWHADHPQWFLARVSGLAALALLTTLVAIGLVLAHPRGTLLGLVRRDLIMRVHIGLAAFTAVFTALHVVVLAVDPHSGVGWAGALVPLGAEYRPIPVTLGWIALYAGLAAGVTARFAGRLGRVWWPIHRVASVTYVAAWLHGVLSGTDTAALKVAYAASLLVVVSIAASRYVATPIRQGTALR